MAPRQQAGKAGKATTSVAAPTKPGAASSTVPARLTPPRAPSSMRIPLIVAIPVLWLGLEGPSWLVLMGTLFMMAVLLLGVGNMKSLREALSSGWSNQTWRRVPLTDAVLGQAVVNKLANSTQCREKTLKIVQYTLRGIAYLENHYYKTPYIKATYLKTLSKNVSIARRFFKFCRWVKHFEDLAEAKEEKVPFMRALLYLRIAANFGADWAEDVCSLERIGWLPKGTLSVEFMLFAEFCQLVLCLTEISVTAVRVDKQQLDTDALATAEALPSNEQLLTPSTSATCDASAAPAPPAATAAPPSKELGKQRRKLALMRLELIKFVSDLGKAVYDCELHFAHEGVFIFCGFFSAIISTHKNMTKVLK